MTTFVFFFFSRVQKWANSLSEQLNAVAVKYSGAALLQKVMALTSTCMSMVSGHVITSAATSGATQSAHTASVFSRSADLLSVGLFFFSFYFYLHYV